MAVGGSDLVQVVDTSRRSASVLKPLGAVALVMMPGEREVAGWRKQKRPGASGIGRDHYDWFIDLYAWPPDRSNKPIATYQIQARQLIAGYWEDRLVAAKAYRGRVIELKCCNEDARASFFVVRGAGGGWRETWDRAEATVWAREG